MKGSVKRVTAVEKSGNSKIGIVSATYVTQAACPQSCPLMGEACYAESGHTAIITRRLKTAAALFADNSPESIASEEAAAIDTLSGTRPLRLHVVGDCVTDAAAQTVAAACKRYTERGSGRAWTYTHAWREVDADAWDGVSVLASCDTPADIAAAQARGYATAVTVPHVLPRGVHKTTDGARIVQCPQQLGLTTCEGCRGLCRDAENMRRRGITVAFGIHGATASRAKDRLVDPLA